MGRQPYISLHLCWSDLIRMAFFSTQLPIKHPTTPGLKDKKQPKPFQMAYIAYALSMLFECMLWCISHHPHPQCLQVQILLPQAFQALLSASYSPLPVAPGEDLTASKPRCDHVEWHQPFLQQLGAFWSFCKCLRPAWKGFFLVPLKPTKCHDLCHFGQVSIDNQMRFCKFHAKLVYNSHVTMVYGRYNYSIHGVYKPTYNWAAPSCVISHEIHIFGVSCGFRFHHFFWLDAAGRQISKTPRCCWVRLWAVGWHDHLGPSCKGVGISRV